MSIDHAHEVLARRRATLSTVASARHPRVALAELLRKPPEELAGCLVHLLLRACPGIGDTKVKELCMATKTWPLDTVGELSTHKREALAHRVGL